MSTATDLSGRELDEAIARALGWGVESWSEWHQSLDMALYDLWPELVRRGWEAFGLGVEKPGQFYGWVVRGDETLDVITETLPLAFARAVLAALTEGGE